MINRVLVANRGEIARRVFHTCRRSGIGTVAVASTADRCAPHAREADVVVELPGAAPAETYLRGDLIIEAAGRVGADAVHPGYGFLSENAAFARQVLDAGLTWIGPPPEAIELMGSKVESKRLMDQAGVPVLGELDPETITEEQLPVLVKASAGGGGRGMRIVHTLAELPEAVAAASAEAASAFGDPAVFCEQYIATGRHIEVQILADRHGNVWPLGERECSIQRRHQKVLEEAPSPMVDTPMRQRLCEAAVLAAHAVDYVGAGTVEFLADDRGDFFFLEMNTRLQVEHPVTECVTGVDLVAWQLRIAEGAELPTTEIPVFHGHAIEARLVAEDPSSDWLPTNGPIHRFEVGRGDTEFAIPDSPGLRVDGGFGAGDAVSVHYDAMLAKVIAWAPTRAEAARLLAGALAASRLHGPVTNRDLLVQVLRHPEFLSGDIDTGFFDRDSAAGVFEPLAGPAAVGYSAIAAALARGMEYRAHATVAAMMPPAWRNVPAMPQRTEFTTSAGEVVGVEYQHTGEGFVAGLAGADGPASPEVAAVAVDAVDLVIDGARYRFQVAFTGDRVDVDSPFGSVVLGSVPRFRDPQLERAAGSLIAPMPAMVTAVLVTQGDTVTAGDPVVVLEAMKMQHTVAAPQDGVVSAVNVAAGQQIETDHILVVIDDSPEGDAP
ncbi:putative acyl-CoA carboxylase alpha chain [Gordonia hirsuta DSM 44140 = NBRC 16056]|uniref:biotin carboxylase n=1 Tax=Gordonia hirsuta DSM 44140 = NBRC 16056 TaxID=1121927 RepID=L7LAW3_9ACTN|nr:biotin carboxylase N-terminal domain-containing protein [Gordonia hirsuta]GAC58280.1 putative acyl-CoA carboxylase alpha chain [Gordonia hirsuta DSM 44140 = NBRC 16056]